MLPPPVYRSKRDANPKLPPKPSSICSACWRGPCAAQFGLFYTPIQLDDGGQYFAGGYSYFRSKSQIKRGAAAGCAWCKFLLFIINPSYRSWVETVKRRPVRGWKITVGSYGSLRFCTPTHAQALAVIVDHGRPRTMLIHTSADDPAAPYVVARDPILNVGSPHALSLANALVRECVDGHQRCIQISSPSDVPLPARLIDCSDPSRSRLVASRGRHGKYLTLSYVWGEPQPHRTTTSNISFYTESIDVSRMPQTIRDAIYVTHALGFQYLWVDSLCIIQDSDEDKLHELARMHLVYRYAYLTIIAASAERVSEGFLQDRLAEDAVTLPFLCPLHSHAPGKSAADVQRVGEVRISLMSIHEGNAVVSNDEDTWQPINARGWCLQEFYMSPRALLFTSETLQFRCQQTRRNVGDSLYRTKNDVWLPDVLFHPDPPILERGSVDWSMVHGRWRDIVQQYSTRSLGEASDKLVACGALAEAFHRVLRADYLAGLWRDTLLHDLLWRCSTSEFLGRPARYRAPSWSWAARDGTVSMLDWAYGGDATAVAEVVRCEVTLKDLELRFGELTGASLVLRAALIQVEIRDAEDGWRHDLLLPPQRGQPSGAHGPVEEGDAIPESSRLTVYCLYDCLAGSQTEREPKWLVPLLRKGPAGQVSEACCLIVAVADPESRTAYQRIGICETDSGDWDTLQLHMERTPVVEIELV